MDQVDANGRKVVITGGFGTLGAAVAGVFAAQADRVVLIDFAGEPPAELSAFEAVANVDLADPTQAQYATAQAASLLGGIDVLVNTAGGYTWEPAGVESFGTLQRMWLINAATCFNACVAALPHMASGGRIVNIGAAAAAKGSAGHSSYAAAKAAVARMTEALADESRDRAIAVNAVLPGIIDTLSNRAAMPDADPSAWTAPAAIADVIAFLASPQARAINGALVPVTAATDD